MRHIGNKYNKWTVLCLNKELTDIKQRKYYKCQCECGKIHNHVINSIKSGRSKQCYECTFSKHSMSKTNIYKIWVGIKSRCYNPKVRIYKYYGGRGIKMCERWLDFQNFYIDMGDRPSGLQLDRINNDGNYEPGNCRWVTAKENNPSNKGCLKDVMPGKVFGKWQVLERVKHRPDHWYYLCRCRCGTEKVICGGELRRGRTTQCRSCKNKQHSIIHTGWLLRKKKLSILCA
jgi:hypothetical protein